LQWNIYTGDNGDSFPSGQNPDGTAESNACSAWFNALQMSPAQRRQIATRPSAVSTNYINTLAGYGGLTLVFLFRARGSVGSTVSDQHENGEPGSYGANLWLYHTSVSIQNRVVAKNWGEIGIKPIISIII
jgi:hypothetical protein